MSLNKFEDDRSEDEQSELDDYCAKEAGFENADFNVLLSNILEAQQMHAYFCVEFENDALLLYGSDSESYIRNLLLKRKPSEWAGAEVIEGWAETIVARGRTFQSNPPLPVEQMFGDRRLASIDSLRTLLDICDDCGGSDNDVYTVADKIFRTQKIDDPPTAGFLSFLEDCLRLGERRDIAGSANRFLQKALQGKQKAEYGKFFDAPFQKRLAAEREIRFNRAMFANETDMYAPAIETIRELHQIVNEVLCEYRGEIMLKKPHASMLEIQKCIDVFRENLISNYLQALDHATPAASISSVVVNLHQGSGNATIRDIAESTLRRLGWGQRNHRWMPANDQNQTCQPNRTSV